MLILAHFGVQLICVSGYHVTHADVYQYVFSQQEESENSVGIYSDIVLLLKNGVWKIWQFKSIHSTLYIPMHNWFIDKHVSLPMWKAILAWFFFIFNFLQTPLQNRFSLATLHSLLNPLHV